MRNLKAEVVRNAAKLKGWDVILRDLCPEIDSRAFDKPGRHTKCPVHGVAGRGGDGFKFFRKDFQDSGGGMCNTCGTYPDGFSLLMWVKNYGFADAVADVGDFLGIRSTEDENQQEKVNRANEQALAARRKELEEKEAASNLYHSKKLNELWKGSLPLTHPDAEPARLYLASRKILCWDREGVERVVRFHPSLSSYNEDGEFEGDFPGIVAKVTKAGLPITLHRYFLTPKGLKAPVQSAKKMCMYPTDRLVTGGGIFVGAWDKEEIDVCEGLETAWAIETGTNFAVQVHSLVNATLLEGFEPGPRTKRVRIWIDKDRSGRGEEAGMNLKKRLWEKGIQAQILTPSLPLLEGEKSVDWNDVLVQLGCMGFPQMREGGLMSVTSYLYDPVRVVTSPGANALDPFSPPSGFSGSAGDYRLLLVSRYRVPASRRYIMAHAKALQDGLNVIFEGPYIMEAADILEKIVASDRVQETKRAG